MSDLFPAQAIVLPLWPGVGAGGRLRAQSGGIPPADFSFQRLMKAKIIFREIISMQIIL